MWPGLQKQGTWARGQFDYFFKLSWFITFYDDTLWSWKFKNLWKIKVATQYKLQNTNILFHCWVMTCNMIGCNLCPNALFSQAQSQCTWKPSFQAIQISHVHTEVHDSYVTYEKVRTLAQLWLAKEKFAIFTLYLINTNCAFCFPSLYPYTDQFLWSAFWKIALSTLIFWPWFIQDYDNQ